jgi:hypothetical protein
MSHNAGYPDPYNPVASAYAPGEQQLPASYASYASTSFLGENGSSDPYRSSSVFGNSNDRGSDVFKANPSTEKILDEYPATGTERAQPGRQRLNQNPVSWADIGPPPRSTGIMRMWRIDERGKQWTRVNRRYFDNAGEELTV